MRLFGLHKVSLIIFLFIGLWWAYLIQSAKPTVFMDALGYVELAEGLIENNFNYFKFPELDREPFYVYFLASVIQFANFIQVDYLLVLKIAQMLILGLSVYLMNVNLKLLRINRVVRRVACFLFALSPAMLNSALSVFSEIVTYPSILLLVMAVIKIFSTIKASKRNWISVGILLVMIVTSSLAVIFTKAIFEPVFIVSFLVIALLPWLSKSFRSVAIYGTLFFIIATGLMLVGTNWYKDQNLKHYQTRSFTDRGDWALFGNTKRRVQPMTQERVLAAASMIPGWGVCQKFFPKIECDYWAHWQSDRFAFAEGGKLRRANYTEQEKKEHYLSETKRMIKDHFAQYSLFLTFEALKMFFWESTQIGFVEYSLWLQKLYKSKAVGYFYRLTFSLLSLLGFFLAPWVLWRCKNDHTVVFPLLSLWIILFFLIGAHSLFFVLSRYIFPIVPIYFLLISFVINHFCFKNEQC